MSESKKEFDLDLSPLFSEHLHIADRVEIIQKIQKSFDDICKANYEAITTARHANQVAAHWRKEVEAAATSINQLADTVQNTFTFLASRRDLFKDDKDYKGLMDVLARFSLEYQNIKAKASRAAQ